MACAITSGHSVTFDYRMRALEHLHALDRNVRSPTPASTSDGHVAGDRRRSLRHFFSFPGFASSQAKLSRSRVRHSGTSRSGVPHDLPSSTHPGLAGHPACRSTRKPLRSWRMQIQAAGATPDAPTTTVAMYYPTLAAPRTIAMGPFALNAAIGGKPLDKVNALILRSHGVSGSELDHSVLAQALARNGYLVAAIRRPGANRQDRSHSSNTCRIASRFSATS